MLKQRIITGLCLAVVLLVFLFAPAPASLVFFAVVVTIAAWEWADLAALSGNKRIYYAVAMAVLIGLACLVGVIRIVRRISNPYMRSISSPDDYFSLVLLTVWFFFATLAVPNQTAGGEWHLLTYFILTAFFLVYVPFSKISHYLYYPFTRYYFGKTMGYRGVYPMQRSVSR